LPGNTGIFFAEVMPTIKNRTNKEAGAGKDTINVTFKGATPPTESHGNAGVSTPPPTTESHGNAGVSTPPTKSHGNAGVSTPPTKSHGNAGVSFTEVASVMKKVRAMQVVVLTQRFFGHLVEIRARQVLVLKSCLLSKKLEI
jgi:hypothetical protein